MSKKPLELDAVIATAQRDSQGEMLDIEGADISALESGQGFWNDNHGRGHFNRLGCITGAKKIFKEEDCEDDRQRYYWNKIKAPLIYAKGYLYDDEDHPNAKACAAVLRSIHKHDAPLKVRASVEGGTIARGIKDPSILARTKIMGSAITFTPANHATLVEPISLNKAIEPGDEALIKSVMHLARTEVPSFIDISRELSTEKIRKNVEQVSTMVKALTAGYGGAGVPTSRTGGSVLQGDTVKKDDKKDNQFKYITCQDCGKEQVHMKHQVKCRECNKSFPLATLVKFLTE